MQICIIATNNTSHVDNTTFYLYLYHINISTLATTPPTHDRTMTDTQYWNLLFIPITNKSSFNILYFFFYFCLNCLKDRPTTTNKEWFSCQHLLLFLTNQLHFSTILLHPSVASQPTNSTNQPFYFNFLLSCYMPL